MDFSSSKTEREADSRSDIAEKRRKIEISTDQNIDQNMTEEVESKFPSVPREMSATSSTKLTPKTKNRIDEPKDKLSNAQKKSIFKYLQETNCSARSFEAIAQKYTVSKDFVQEHFQKQIDNAEAHVNEECNSLSFANIEKWLKLFKESGLPDICLYETAIVVNAIANNEQHPDVVQMKGVDLKAIYRFIGHALLGLPQQELDEQSSKFLANEFEMLVAEANTAEGDNDTKSIKNRLLNQTALPKTLSNQKVSLDPLLLHDDIDNVK